MEREDIWRRWEREDWGVSQCDTSILTQWLHNTERCHFFVWVCVFVYECVYVWVSFNLCRKVFWTWLMMECAAAWNAVTVMKLKQLQATKISSFGWGTTQQTSCDTIKQRSCESLLTNWTEREAKTVLCVWCLTSSILFSVFAVKKNIYIYINHHHHLKNTENQHVCKGNYI